MLGWGLNIVVGLAGLLDLGYVAFYAVGAYSYALLATTFGLSFWICLPLAGILAAFWGILLGFPVLRLRGDYLAIVTLAFGEIIRLVLINWVDLTNGDAGISGDPARHASSACPSTPSDDGFAAFFGLEFTPMHRTIFLYYLILALALLTNFVTLRLRTPAGRARLGGAARGRDRLPLARHQHHQHQAHRLRHRRHVRRLRRLVLRRRGRASSARRASTSWNRRSSWPSSCSAAWARQIGVAIAAVVHDRRHRDPARARLPQARSSARTSTRTQYRMLLFGLGMVLMMIWRPRGLISTREPSVFLKERKAVSRPTW